MSDAPLAVLGATGYTGALVLDEARARGLALRLVGRRPNALAAAARPGEDVRTADARDEGALSEAFDGAFAVVSLAGPFSAVGTAPVAAAIAVGAHYLDTSGEQAFARRVYSEFADEAKAAGVALLTSFGFDYAIGDLAARLAAEPLQDVAEVRVAYAISRPRASAGTRRTLAHLLAQDHVAWEGARVVPSRFGATVARMSFPGAEHTVVEWGGTEPLTVPRHTSVARVRSYVRAPRVAASLGGFGRFAAPLLRASSAIGARGPSAARRAETTFAVVAEAKAPSGARRVTLTGSDVYRLTALLIAHGADALRSGEQRAAGALAPAEAFEASAFLERLAPLVQLARVEEL